MSKFLCVKDYEDQALQILSPHIRDYYSCGAGEEDSLKGNKEAFKKIRILPRILRNVTKVDISTTILGEKIPMPLGISPTAYQRMAHPDGECATAKAAEREGAIFILSSMASSTIEEVTAAAPKAIKWLQLYIFVDRKILLDLIRRAEKSGFKALAITVDSPTSVKGRKFVRNSHLICPLFKHSNFEAYNISDEYMIHNNYLLDPAVSWDDISWLKSQTRLPIVLKGILTVDDALLAIKFRADGILISNHGGRQLDGVPATIEALPEISKAVGDKLEVYIDGGITQGTDVLKALALGAKMVFFGRPLIWGLACNGEEGARDILGIMKKEISSTFSLSGKPVFNQLQIHERGDQRNGLPRIQI